jgi:hypothetical protein
MNKAIVLTAWICLMSVATCRAQESGAPAPAPHLTKPFVLVGPPVTLTAYENAAPFGCHACGAKAHESCVHHFLGWLSYRAAWTKDGCGCCHKCCACCAGPLYTFFMCTPKPMDHVGNGFYIDQYPTVVAPCGP